MIVEALASLCMSCLEELQPRKTKPDRRQDGSPFGYGREKKKKKI